MNKLPRFIWVKEDNEKISLAPWLLGSTILYKDTDNIKTVLNTFENYPIDSFCTSSSVYEMLDKQHQNQPNTTHLKQLFSTEPITDPKVKSRWYSLTNLHIQDGESNSSFPFITSSLLILECVAISANLNNKSSVQSILKSSITTFKDNKFENMHETDQHRIQVQQLLSPA